MSSNRYIRRQIENKAGTDNCKADIGMPKSNAAGIVPGFAVHGWIAALLFSLIISLK